MIIYQLYIDKFNKNIQGLIEKLDYLVNLGVDTLWILPQYPSPMVDGGYDVSDYCNIRPDLGTIEDFTELTTTAHKRGLKILIDLILNHTSTEHDWFKQARSSKSNPKRDFYIWNSSGTDMLTSVNAFPNIKLSNWVYNPFTNDYYFATFYTIQPDLNWDTPEVFDSFTNTIDFWVDLGVDSFRLDAMTHLIKRRHTLSVCLPETHIIVKKIRSYINSKYQNVTLVGEADVHSYKAKEYFGNSDECNCLFDFENSTKLLLYLFNNNEKLLEDILSSYLDKPENTDWIYFLGSHDTVNTSLLSPADHDVLTAFLDPDGKYLKTHDKRLSLRVAEMFNGDVNKIVNAYKNLFILPGSKVIYYGDEIGLKNKRSKEFLIDNRFEVRGEFDWAEYERQKNDNNSLLNRITEIIHTSKHPKQKS